MSKQIPNAIVKVEVKDEAETTDLDEVKDETEEVVKTKDRTEEVKAKHKDEVKDIAKDGENAAKDLITFDSVFKLGETQIK